MSIPQIVGFGFIALSAVTVAIGVMAIRRRSQPEN